MRTIKELLILLREKLPEYINRVSSGSICWTLTELYREELNEDEYDLLLDYIGKNKPDDAGSYFVGNGMNRINGFWWPYGELAPRLEFLDKLISEL